MYYAVENQPVITGRDIRTARPSVGQLNQPIVEFQLKPEAAAVFAEATGANIGSQIAIVLDGRVVSAPRINARISDSGIIEGGFTREEAHDLAVMLRSGPLPARLTVVDERIVGRSGG
jgi:preprotein translocase subunit SecD